MLFVTTSKLEPSFRKSLMPICEMVVSTDFLDQGRSSTKIVGGAKVSKKFQPPWLADGESFRFRMT